MRSNTYTNRYDQSSENKVMNPDQFERVMTAIVEGRYSWACVLILQFAGYNPAHYIPYRTYKRLIKSNRTVSRSENAVTKPGLAPNKTMQTCAGTSRH